MELMFLGAAHEVTGSCHYLQVGKKKFLVDCGMEQGIDRFGPAGTGFGDRFRLPYPRAH